MLTPERIQAIREACEKATAGEWKAIEHVRLGEGGGWWSVLQGAWDISHNYADAPGVVADARYSSMTPEENAANARFIALARSAVPELLNEVERLQGEAEWAINTGMEEAVQRAWLLEERDRLRERLAESAELSVKRMVAEAGSIDLILQAEILPVLVELFAVAFEEHNATNYLEMRAVHDRLGVLAITVQRCEGLTPHEAREAAEREVAELRRALNPEPTP